MPLQKQPVSLNFSQGLDTKTDAYQIAIGKFLALNNSVFTTGGRLTKRSGFANITNLPNSDQTTLTTLNDNLIATGSNLYSFSADTNQWINKGSIQPVNLSVQSMVRSSTAQISPDSAVTSNGLLCLSYMDSGNVYYQISDSVTGEQIVSRTQLPNGTASPRSFLLGRYFIVTFISTIGGSTHLQYVSIPISNPLTPNTVQDISTTLVNTLAGYDGFVANNNLYLAWGDTGTTVKIAYLSSTLVLSAPVVIAGHYSTLMSVTADISASTAVIWATFWDSTSTNGFTTAYSQALNPTPILAPTQIITATVIREITSVATNSLLTVFYENFNTYVAPYPVAGIETEFISKLTVTQSGTVSSTTIILRSVGLASKAFIGPTGTIYVVVAYGETNQPTYFLIDSSGAIFMRLAYSNGGGYETNQVLPSVLLLNDNYLVPYLIKDFLAAVNKGTNLPSGTPTNGIYTQTGINLARFSINISGQHSSEIADVLHLTGGQLWEYDTVRPVEHGFHVWPENIQVTTATTGGLITAHTYFYVFTYEWTDNEGKLQRSAPSIPFEIVTTGSTSTNTCYVPTLRLTYKLTPNPVRIVGYRWSTEQPVYYQFTSITTPTINNTTVDYVIITDTKSDDQILGQTLLYTTGGVVENIAAPASTSTALFKNRLFLIDAEDRNLLWYSKQVIEGVPVEMSDLFTIYVAPTSGAQGSTGPITALSAMDDKLIIFKQDAIYYLTGTGPDNTGANNDFTDPVFITSSVGCANQNSIILMPNGIMFQSDKGIWLLGRDLSTQYIGAPVEEFNPETVQSSNLIPGTNQVRFIINDSTTLMYDYYYQQWGTFSNIRAISSTLYQGLHTYLSDSGQIFQEAQNTFIDGTVPVLMSFTTAWINIGGIQGYERFYFGYLLGTYFTPFKLNVQLGYDYNVGNTQNIMVAPDNFVPPWGGEPLWGSNGPWGGPGNVFESRFFPQVQKCESFQVTINEIYDSTFDIPPGQGLSLSGLNLIVGIKKGYRTQSTGRSFG